MTGGLKEEEVVATYTRPAEILAARAATSEEHKAPMIRSIETSRVVKVASPAPLHY